MATRKNYLRLLLLAMAALIVLTPLLAAASSHEEGGEHGLSPAKIKDFIYRIVNFSILAALLYFLLRKPLSGFVLGRRQEIQDTLLKAEKAKADAEAKYKEYEEKLKALEQEAAELRKNFQVHGEQEKAMIVQKAKEEAGKIKQLVEAAAQNELKRATAALQKEASDLAVKLALDLLRKSVTPEDQKRLISEYLHRMEELN